MFNQSIIIGNLTKDPETAKVGETQVTKFSVAVNRDYKSKDGSELVDFFNVETWGKLAEICEQHLTKGKQVFVEGGIHFSTYEKDGIKFTATTLKANKVKFLGKKG